MPIANEDVGFRARGPRNQYIPPINEENLRDNAYATMKKGGKVVGSSASMPRIKKVKKKGKATASATAIVNVYTGRRGRTAPAQPRPPKPPQPINVSVQLPNYMSSFEPRFRSDYEPLQSTRLRETYLDQPIRMVQHDQPNYLINRGEPMKIQGDYEPSYLINRGEPMKEQGDYERVVKPKEEPKMKINPVPKPKDPYEPLNLDNLFTDNSFGDLKRLPREKDPLEMKQLQDYPHIRFVELGRPNIGEPIRQQDDYEPYDPIEMKHEKEPDEPIEMEQALQPYTPYQVDTPPYVMTPPESPEVAAEAAGGEAPVRRKRRTKEEMEIFRLAQEEAKRIKQEVKQQQAEAKKRLDELKEEQDADRIFEEIRQLRVEITRRQQKDPDDPQLPKLRRNLDKLTKK